MRIERQVGLAGRNPTQVGGNMISGKVGGDRVRRKARSGHLHGGLLRTTSLFPVAVLGVVLATSILPAHGQSLIPTLAGGSGGGGAQASTGTGTNGTGLGYAGGGGGGAGSVGGTGGDAGKSGTTVPNSGGAGGTAGGGAGGKGSDYIAVGGGNAGGGGGGAHAYTGTTLPGGSSRTGGAGGTGGTGGDPTADNHSGGTGGGGGGGGFGAVVEANGALGTLAIGLTGGAGGAGGNTTEDGYNYAGTGGTGGGGLYLSSTLATSLTVSSVVTGGAGGAGGTTGNQYAIVYGGAGGSGIYAGNSSAVTTLTLTGTAQAIGGSGGVGSSADYAGAAGVGIAGENLSIILAAGTTVRAGQSSTSFSSRSAIQFIGDTNSLELQGNGGTSGQTYATIDGNVVGSGTTTLKLTGAGGTFDLSSLNLEQGFIGFSGVTVNSTGKWIVGGAPTDQTATWTVTGGTLANGLAGAPTATLGGDTSIGAGAGLSATAVSGESAFTINGDLSLNATSALNITLGAPNSTALITVNGDLSLNGTLNIADAGTMAPGTYTLISYSGSYFGSGLTIGTTPATDFKYVLSTSTANLVTLSVNLNGLYWNGTTTSGTGVVVGGNGTWTAGPTTNWLDASKTANVASSANMPALFAGTAGTVTVNTTAGAVSAEGLRFETTGYILTGATGSDTLALAIAEGIPKVSVVGDSTVATIALPLTGTQGLDKTGTGKLILTGANTYTGNTTITDGTLQLGDGTTTGTVVGNITNNKALVFNPTGLTAAYAGVISGTGTVEKAGAGWQTLSGNNTYSGVTTVSGGLLLVSNNSALGTTAGRTVVSSGATLGLYGTGITIFEPLTLSGFGASNFGALASFRGDSVNAGTNTVAGAITLAADASIVNSGGVGDILNLGSSITSDGKSLYLGGSTGAANTVSGQISLGSGAVGIASGSWVFTNINTYTGGTFIFAGATLKLDNLALSNTASTNVSNLGTLILGGSYASYNANIAGSGVVEVVSSVYMYGTNTYTGETRVKSGSLIVKNISGLGSTAAGTTVSQGANLTFSLAYNSRNTIEEPLTISGSGSEDAGALVFDAGKTAFKGQITLAADAKILAIRLGTEVDLQGAITGAGKKLTLTVNYYGSSIQTVSGVIGLGSGGVAIEGGEWVFSAQNTYTGVTTISAATYSSLPSAPAKLRVNGSLAGGVVVNSGGTLAGSGIVKGTKVNNGGTIAPGNSPGTLTVDGALEMETGSTYQVDVTPTGEHDLLIVTGNVTIANGATLEVIAEPGVYAASSTLTILSSSGTITGTFTNVISDYAFLTPSIESDGQNIFLTLLYNDALFTSYARTPNQFAVAGAAQTLGAGNPVFDAIVSLPADAVPNAYNQLSGEVHASAQSVYMEQSSLIRSALADRLRAAQGGVGASSAPVVSYEGAGSALGYGAASPVQVAADLAMPMKAVAAPATTEKFALWTAAFGNWGSFDGNANAASLDASTGGFLMGADATIADGWRLGIAGGYSFTDFSIADRASSGSSENWHIGLYGGKVWGALALRSGVAYTLQDVSTTRSVGFPGFYDSLTADYDVGTLQAFGELGYRIDTPFAAFEPYVNLAYVSLDSGSYAERGGSAALVSDGSDMGTTFTTLGLRVSKALTFDSYEVTLRGVLGWRHAFGDITPAVSQAFVSSDAFTVTGVPVAEDAAVLELGLDMLVGANTTLGIAYTGQFGDGVTQNGFNAVLKASF